MSTTQYQVLVRGGSPDLFVASVLGIEDCVGEGRTREEAIAKAKAALVDRLAHGEVITSQTLANVLARLVIGTQSHAPRLPCC